MRASDAWIPISATDCDRIIGILLPFVATICRVRTRVMLSGSEESAPISDSVARHKESWRVTQPQRLPALSRCWGRGAGHSGTACRP